MRYYTLYVRCALLLLLSFLSGSLTTAVLAQGPAQAPGPANHFARADSLFAAQDWKNARQEFRRLLADTARNAVEWNRLGFSDYNLGLYDEALAAYLKSAADSPVVMLQPILFSRMAMVYANRNDKARAMENLDKAVAAGYYGFDDMDTMKVFAGLRGDPRFKGLRDKAYATAYPCTANPKWRVFDFWIGEWNAYVTGSNVLAGYSVIQSASGGCMVLENWTSARLPYNGKSMNFIDAATGKWEQIWVGAEGGPQGVFTNGEYRDSAMHFDFEQTRADGKKQKGRFTFFNQGPNQVRQLNETSDDDGKTWNIAYDLTYVRKKKMS